MELFASLLTIAGFVGLCVGVVRLIVAAIKHKNKKKELIFLGVAVAVLFAGICMMPSESPEVSSNPPVVNTPTTGSSDNSNTNRDMEVFAAKFCMAYMNSLKNPYSFKVRSIWAYQDKDGRYEVYVKFTAENSLGAEIADEIGTMSSLTESDLDQLAQGGIYVDLYTWGSEPTYIGLGRGVELNAAKIQAYINENYK